MDAQTLSQEVDANFDFFQRRLGEFLECEAGKFALLRHRAVIGFYPDPGTADQVGHANFPDGLYSIQEVTDEPVNLGLYSNASHKVAARRPPNNPTSIGVSVGHGG